MPNPKQANHFHMKYAKESLEAYRADFVRASGAKGTTDVAGEATATYSMCAQVPPRVHAELPRAVVVLVLRNEIDRAASHYARCRYKVGACFGFGSGFGFGLAGERVRVRGLEGQGYGQWSGSGRVSGQGQGQGQGQ
jgi:hypothetical protein